MATLRLTRKTFVRATITVASVTGSLRQTREVTDFDAWQGIAMRAMNNPLAEYVSTIVIVGDMSKVVPNMEVIDYILGYDDGEGTMWEGREWAKGCRDAASGKWGKLFGNMPLGTIRRLWQAHRDAGECKSWLWAAWDGTQLIGEEGEVLA